MNVTTLSRFSQDIFFSNPFGILTTNKKIITILALAALSCIAIAIFFHRRGSFNPTITVHEGMFQDGLQKLN